MFLFLLLVLQPGLRAWRSLAAVWSCCSELWLFTHRATLDLSIYYISVCLSATSCLSVSAHMCVSVCIRAAPNRVPCWLQSALFSRLHVSRYRRFPPGFIGSHIHSHKHTHTHGHRDTCTPTHTCALSSLSLSLSLSISVFVLPLADFVFADNRWADIDALLNNKYTLCL